MYSHPYHFRLQESISLASFLSELQIEEIVFVFVYLLYKALHLDLVNDVTATTCFRHFSARRGFQVKLIKQLVGSPGFRFNIFRVHVEQNMVKAKERKTNALFCAIQQQQLRLGFVCLYLCIVLMVFS